MCLFIQIKFDYTDYTRVLVHWLVIAYTMCQTLSDTHYMYEKTCTGRFISENTQMVGVPMITQKPNNFLRITKLITQNTFRFQNTPTFIPKKY